MGDSSRLTPRHSGKYILFDCPGQVEVFTHHDALRKVIDLLLKRDLRVRFHLANSLRRDLRLIPAPSSYVQCR